MFENVLVEFVLVLGGGGILTCMFASSKREMHTHAEVAVTAEGDVV